MKNADKNINNKDNLNAVQNKKSNKFDVLGLTVINGINFKKAAELHVELNINSIEELYQACKEGKVRSLKGWGEIIENKIKSEIELNVLWIHTQCAKVNNKSKKQLKEFDKEFLLNLVKEQANKNFR
tara:strand:- start:1089 stop:1469 length:381 start_codon:yes stop_codon:yes gene_type:complete